MTDSSTSEPRRPEGRDDAAMLELFVEYQRTGDMRLRNELITKHMRLAEYLAGRFANRGEPVDDLRQVALIGLLKAVERFDPMRGLKFTSFATPTILGEIKRHFRDRGWTVRVPRRVQELHLQLDGITADLSQELGRPPTPGEIARRAGVREEDVLEGMEAGGMYNLGSIDAHPDQEGQPASARIGATDPALDSLDERIAVQQMLKSLPEREQRIVYLRFYEGLTQSEIAERVGISQMHVSRLLMKSLELMAAHSAAGGIDRPS
jgi:RNA polymerase sigma-B factor